MSRPSGLALSPTTVYVGSHTTGAIHAVDRETWRLTPLAQVAAPASIAGITLDPQGALVFVDTAMPATRRLDVTSKCSPAGVGAGGCTNGAKDGDESGADCGGASCARCARGEVCATPTDCASGVCNATDATCVLSKPVYQNSSVGTLPQTALPNLLRVGRWAASQTQPERLRGSRGQHARSQRQHHRSRCSLDLS